MEPQQIVLFWYEFLHANCFAWCGYKVVDDDVFTAKSRIQFPTKNYSFNSRSAFAIPKL